MRDEKNTPEDGAEEKPRGERPHGGEPAARAAVMSGSAEAGEDSSQRGLPDVVRFPLVLAIVGAASALSLALLYAATKDNIERSRQAKVEEAFRSVFGDYDRGERKGEGDRAYRAVLASDGSTLGYAAVVSCPGSYNSGNPIQLLVILDARGTRVLGARVISSAETPGLGEQIREPPSELSIWGWVTGRKVRERVVLTKGGALVGRIEERPDGSFDVVLPDGTRKACAADQVEGQPRGAPFPAAFMDKFTGRSIGEAKLKSDGGAVDAITGATISSRAVAAGVQLAAERLKERLKEDLRSAPGD